MIRRILLLAAALFICATATAEEVDVHHLPLGDGRLSDEPKTGFIWACRVEPNAGGAFRDGPWIHKLHGTYDATKKTVVQGHATWQARFTIRLGGDRRIFETNDLPEHATGTYPIAASDPAYAYDRNPNRIQAQKMSLSLPADPVLAPAPSCAPGAVGILLTGAVLFNALDAPGRDAVAHEAQDACDGHPQDSGVYHYHSLSACLPDKRLGDGSSDLVGYALDGFGIFGLFGEGGRRLTGADLDACHGRTSAIPWNGKMVVMYHYVATADFPYTVGCMRGRYQMADVMTVSGPPPQPLPGGMPAAGQAMPGQPTGGGPDLAAAAAKLGIDQRKLQDALGPPPPDLSAAASKLGISEDALRQALGVP